MELSAVAVFAGLQLIDASAKHPQQRLEPEGQAATDCRVPGYHPLPAARPGGHVRPDLQRHPTSSAR